MDSSKIVSPLGMKPFIVTRPYTLFCHPIQRNTHRIVKWLYRHGIDARPHEIITANHSPNDAPHLPIIVEPDGDHHRGMYECLTFYARICGMEATDLTQVAEEASLDEPDWNISTTDRWQETPLRGASR